MTEATITEDTAETAESVKTEVFTDNDEVDFAEAERNLDTIVAAKVAEQVAEQVAIQMAAILARQARDAEGPPKAMTANVYDRFVANSNNAPGVGGEVIAHYRCDSAISTKQIVFDMELMDQYTSGDLEIPRNDQGRKLSIESLCVIPGETIDWVAGHCYVYTENQKRNIERAQERARLGLQGGMAGIYLDTGEHAVDWQCFTCPQQPKFSNQETYVNHMNATHGANLMAVAS